MKKTALLSVYHKDGIVEFAQGLVRHGWNILASGGTAKALTAAGIAVRDIGELVGGPMLGHRVVTLSREIHAGLLARSIDEDMKELERLGIPRIDLVCVDLYPLEAEIAKAGSTKASVIEMTDVGGPTMLHSAAKGERFVIADPLDRQKFIAWLDAGSPDEESFRDAQGAKADAVVSAYCLTASRYRSSGRFDGLVGERVSECKYGENGWQTPAGLYRTESDDPLALHAFTVIAGSTPSYNNLCDLDRLLQTATHIAAAWEVDRGTVPRIALGVKHGNACGAAVGDDPVAVATNMVGGDTRAIFGGLVLLTFPVSAAVAEALVHAHMQGDAKRLLDGVIAPSFAPEAVEILARKAGKCRLIVNPALEKLSAKSLNVKPRLRQVRGGFLQQPNYTFVLDLKNALVERHGTPTPAQEEDILLGWAIGSTSNSNTITLVKDRALIGNGVGQQDRVGCAELALKRAKDAGHDARGAAAYSDSFFPFTDGPETLITAGVTAIFASSGSVRDSDTIALCKTKNVTLLMIPDASGRGFFGH